MSSFAGGSVFYFTGSVNKNLANLRNSGNWRSHTPTPAKANNNYMKDYGKNKELSYVQYWNADNLYGWEMPKRLHVNNFEWIKDTSKFNEYSIKNYNEESGEGYFLEVDV